MLFGKAKIISVLLAIFIFAFSINTFAQFVSVNPLTDLTVSEKTGEKPQSKVWYHDGKWWAVLPNSSGTHLWLLDNDHWTSVLDLTNDTDTKADCLVDGDTTHIFLYRGQNNNKLVSLEYNNSTGQYALWSKRSSIISINLDSGVEVGVIDIDDDDVMWLANAGTSQIYVRWSEWPYSSWYDGSTNTNRYKLNSSNVDDDDICDVTAFGGNKVGVLWSNQNDEKFYFKYHNDGDAGNVWSTLETAAQGSDLHGVADDHINFAVDGGVIYAAIKTSYDASGYTRMGLLRRLSDGTWDLFPVTISSSDGTRPIALLNTYEQTIKVIYANDDNNPTKIAYKEASISDLNSFTAESTLVSGDYNNVTSTKQNFTYDVVILASNSSKAVGVIAYDNAPTPVELSLFNANLMNDKVILSWRTETEVNNYGFSIEKEINDVNWSTIGFVEGNGNSNSPKEYYYYDSNVNQPGKYSYRLKQIDNDGAFKYSDIVTINVSTPNGYYLSQNYPNPFNPSTTINYKIANDEKVSLKVYDLLGREVASLVDEYKPAGNYSVSFNANELASGVYIYRLVAGDYVSIKRMTLIK